MKENYEVIAAKSIVCMCLCHIEVEVQVTFFHSTTENNSILIQNM